MLTEIEYSLLKAIREHLTELPAEKITIETKPSSFPAIVISSLKFRFKNAGLVENIEQEKTVLEDSLSGDGATKVYKLHETPLRKSVIVESPPGTLLTEKNDYVVNYDNGSIIFLKAPDKGKGNMLIRYNSRKSVMTLKTIKVRALYSIEVSSQNRTETDTLAEKVVKALLMVEDELLIDGIGIRSIGGMFSHEEEKVQKITLKYIVEKDMRIEQVVGPMERIVITRKNI
jgi:hypothetical protein